MRFPVLGAVLSIVLCSSRGWAQSPADPPTKPEIAAAYRSKSGEGGSWTPGTHWERWRIKEIRGWKLRFRRVGDEKHVGVRILKYQAVAERNKICAEYQITDVQPTAPPNVQIKPSLVVEPGDTKSCR